MKKQRETVFYDNYDIDAYYQGARESLQERHFDLYGEEDYEPDDSEIWEEAYWLMETDYEEAKDEINRMLCSNVLVTGTVSLWDGTYDGGKVYSALDIQRRKTTLFDHVISKIGRDCEYFKIYLSGGVLHVECSHHDGTNHFEIRNMTEAGFMAYGDWCYDVRFSDLSEREFFTRMAKSKTWTDKIREAA